MKTKGCIAAGWHEKRCVWCMYETDSKMCNAFVHNTERKKIEE